MAEKAARFFRRRCEYLREPETGYGVPGRMSGCKLSSTYTPRRAVRVVNAGRPVASREGATLLPVSFLVRRAVPRPTSGKPPLSQNHLPWRIMRLTLAAQVGRPRTSLVSQDACPQRLKGHPLSSWTAWHDYCVCCGVGWKYQPDRGGSDET